MMAGVLAAIPYTTFPTIDFGPVGLKTFGLMVAIGVALGAWLAARWGGRFGVPTDDTYRLATRLVVAGFVGARLTWVASHLDQIGSPLDVIAVWKGGLQFSGGFAAAVIAGLPAFRRIPREVRWHSIDGYAYGLTIGLAFGRVGCYAVGEHFGRLTSFPLAVRYDGGAVRESTFGTVALREGLTFHNTALHELLFLLVLFGALMLLRRHAERRPGLIIGVFAVSYGVVRFLTDTLRVSDERVAALTGAQALMLLLIAAGGWILVRATRLPPANSEPVETGLADGPGAPHR